MDLESLKAKRDERIKAKKDRIKLDMGDQSAPVVSETKEGATEEKK